MADFALYLCDESYGIVLVTRYKILEEEGGIFVAWLQPTIDRIDRQSESNVDEYIGEGDGDYIGYRRQAFLFHISSRRG